MSIYRLAYQDYLKYILGHCADRVSVDVGARNPMKIARNSREGRKESMRLERDL